MEVEDKTKADIDIDLDLTKRSDIELLYMALTNFSKAPVYANGVVEAEAYARCLSLTDQLGDVLGELINRDVMEALDEVKDMIDGGTEGQN